MTMLKCLVSAESICYTAAAVRSIQVELGKVEGFWSALQLLQQALAKYLNVEPQAYWLLIQK